MGGFIRDVTGVTDQKKAASQASNQQYQSTLAAIESAEAARDQYRADLRPFRGVANNVLFDQYRQAMQPVDYSYDPRTDDILNYALDRSDNAVLNIAAAQGRAGAGGTRQALIEASAPIMMNRQSQLFNQTYNAQNQRFNQLFNAIGGAQNAAAGMGNSALTTGNAVSNLQTQGGNALAAGTIQRGNANAIGFNNMLGLGTLAASAAGGFGGMGGGLAEGIYGLGQFFGMPSGRSTTVF